LCHLALNAEARRKFIKLLDTRYDPDTDMVTIEVDRCPVRKQNRDFFDYVLTALYFESWVSHQLYSVLPVILLLFSQTYFEHFSYSQAVWNSKITV